MKNVQWTRWSIAMIVGVSAVVFSYWGWKRWKKDRYEKDHVAPICQEPYALEPELLEKIESQE